MIEVKNLTKRYRSGLKPALSDVSFNVNEGEVVGFLGPNGAGKTTTMNIITGYLMASSGSVRVAGDDVFTEPIKAKRHIGYLPENPPLYLDMTVGEYLSAVCDLKGVKKREGHLAEICRQSGIQDVTGRLIKNLSKGYRQRVGIAQALVGDPKAVILDEPTSGLDPAQIIEIRALIRELGKSRTVILSTHILPEVSAICQRILVISEGKIVADGSPTALAEKFSERNKLIVRIIAEPEVMTPLISGIQGVVSVECQPSTEDRALDYVIETSAGVDIRPELNLKLAEAGLPILMLRPQELSLEEVFIKLTFGKRPDDEASSAAPQTEKEEAD